jgi:hypothetical protein
MKIGKWLLWSVHACNTIRPATTGYVPRLEPYLYMLQNPSMVLNRPKHVIPSYHDDPAGRFTFFWYQNAHLPLRR